MTQILLHLLLRLTLGGSLITLLLLATRPIARKFLSARWRRLACGAAMFFFIIAVQLPASVPETLPPTPPAQPHSAWRLSEAPTAPEETRRVNFPNSLHSVWMLVWLGGAVMFIAYHLTNWRRFSRSVLTMSQCPDESTRTLYRDVCGAMGIRRPPELLCCYGVGAPMLAGVFRPRLLLPVIPESDSLELVLRHELTHYKKGDILLKWAALAVSVLHWFNPLAYVPGRLLESDCELACDEGLALSMDAEQRRHYGKMILELMSCERTPLSIPFSRKQQFKERLEAMLKVKKRSRLLSCAATAVLLVFGAIASSMLAYALPAPTIKGTATETRPPLKISGISEKNPAPVTSGGASETAFGPEADSGSTLDFIPSESYTTPGLSGDPAQKLIQKVMNSINWVNDEIQFTIPPEAPPQGEYWVIHIAGRSPEGHSLHWLEAESDGKLWVSGKTYSFPLDPAAFLGQGEIDPEAAKALCEITVGLAGANASSAETYTAYPAADWVKLQKQTTPEIPEYVPVIVLSPPMDNEILGVNGYLGHIGLDYSGPAGKHVLAAADGIVTGIAEDGNGNQTIFINHGNGIETLYDLCSGALVKEGDSVKQGQALAVINRSGSQPPHLHFEVHLNGHPVDPSPYLPGR